MNFNVSFFDNLKNTTPACTLNLIDILQGIKSGKWKNEVESCLREPEYKKQLPCFTPAGIFSKRNSHGLIHYSGIVCLDIDNVEHANILKNTCKNIPWIWAAFITPSQRGLKVLVITTSTQNDFKSIESDIAFSFFELTGYMRDDRSKDLARVQFVSYDTDLYLNENAVVFEKRSH